jgi:hypothetical protein
MPPNSQPHKPSARRHGNRSTSRFSPLKFKNKKSPQHLIDHHWLRLVFHLDLAQFPAFESVFDGFINGVSCILPDIFVSRHAATLATH